MELVKLQGHLKQKIVYNGYIWEIEELLNADPFDPRLLSETKALCYIDLSNRVDCFAVIDAEDADLKKHLWSHTFGSGERVGGNQKGKDKIYARRTWKRNGKSGVIWLHREICERAKGPPPSIYHVCDHLNGDSLDCRRHNLRWATLSENNKNKFGTAWLQMRINFDE